MICCILPVPLFRFVENMLCSFASGQTVMRILMILLIIIVEQFPPVCRAR